jgi:NitT/TauT family transport system ATP-binding protein
LKSSLLQAKNISKYHERSSLEKIQILESINFSIDDSEEGKIISVLAPFGAGKTTLMKIISALDKPSAGEVLLLGKQYKDPAGEIAYMPENPSHFPWLNVKDNIKLLSQIRDVKEPLTDADKIISLIGLTGYEDHIPHNRSLGFRFRVAFGRALGIAPKIILLDDVFKSFDMETKIELFTMIKEIKKELKLTILLASANVTDAVILSDQIYLMSEKPGKIIGEIIPEKLNKVSGNTKTEEFTSIRKEIESAYQDENFSSSINISI